MQGLGAVDPCQTQIDQVKGLALVVQTNQSVLQGMPAGTPEAALAPLRDLYNKSVTDLASGQAALSACRSGPGGSGSTGSTDYTIYYILGGVAVLGVLAYYKTKGRF